MREPRTGAAAAAVAIVLSVIAAFAVGVGVNTAWARTTLLDTDGFLTNISQPLLADPAAKDALARELTEQALANLDFSEGLVDLVPFPLRVAASQVGDQVIAELEGQLQPAIRAQLDSAVVAQTWDRASREVHRQLVTELESGNTSTTITVDLHDVLIRAIHDVGVEVQQNYPSLPFVTEVIDGIGSVLPPNIGVVPIDVSQVQGPARVAIANAAGIQALALVLALAVLAVALVVSRRRGLTVLVFGVALVVMAVGGYGVFALTFGNAGATVAAQSTAEVSADVQEIIDIQGQLIVASYRPWALGLAVAGIVVALVGAVWAARGPRSPQRVGAAAAVGPAASAATGWDMPSAPPVR